MRSVLRILDANANRAREALRVMEEAARFLLDDAELAKAIKSARHDLSDALRRLPGPELWRDTPGDVGTRLSTPQEGERRGPAEVAAAAAKRLSEALRVLEEYGKLLPPETAGFAAAIEAIRYRGYELERRLTLAMGSGRGVQWRLCVLLSERLCPGGDWRGVADAVLSGGADCVQLREKDLDAGELLRRARWLADRCRKAGASLVINDRPDVALASGAHGVHLGQHDLPCAEARRIVGGALIIGVSTSKLDQARAARAAGADYCGVGPMFPTTTKHKDVIAGPAYLAEYVAWGRLPHLAIGGIDAARVAALRDAGVRGVAASSAVCGAEDPRAACRAILVALGGPDQTG